MKKYFVFILASGIAVLSAFEQLPKNAEDISPLLIGENVQDVTLKATDGRFIVNTSGNIQFEYINPDYKMRLSAEMLIAVLKELKKEQE